MQAQENKPIADQIRELSIDRNAPPQADMLKVIDNFNRSAQYFNSYGIKPSSSKGNTIKSQEKQNGKESTFWELN